MGIVNISRIQPALGTAAEWTSANPVLALGEHGYESDTKNYKIGDGVNAWNSLAYFYQSGLWTPTLKFGGASIGITYSIQTGQFEKFGAMVHVSGFITLTNKGSSTGLVTLESLPFTVLNNNGAYSAAAIYLNGVSFANQAFAFGVTNTNYIIFRESTEAGTITDLTNSDFANSSQVMVSLTYKTAY